MWAIDEQLNDVVFKYGMCAKAIRRIFDKLRMIVTAYMDEEPVRLGGPGIIC